jgi:hypothetical protein
MCVCTNYLPRYFPVPHRLHVNVIQDKGSINHKLLLLAHDWFTLDKQISDLCEWTFISFGTQSVNSQYFSLGREHPVTK